MLVTTVREPSPQAWDRFAELATQILYDLAIRDLEQGSAA